MDRTIEMDKECIKIWDVMNARMQRFECDSFSGLQEKISVEAGIQTPHQLLLVQSMKLEKNNWRSYSSATWYLYSVNDPSWREIEDTCVTPDITSDPGDHGENVDMQTTLTNARSKLNHLVEATGALRCFAGDEIKFVNTKIQDSKRIFMERWKSVDTLLTVLDCALKLLGPRIQGDLRELQEVKQKYSAFLQQFKTHESDLSKYREDPYDDSNFKTAVGLFGKHRVEAEMNMAHFERLKVLSTGKADLDTKNGRQILVNSLDKLDSDLRKIYLRSSNRNSLEIQKLNEIWKIRNNVDGYSKHQTQLTETVAKWQDYVGRLKRSIGLI